MSKEWKSLGFIASRIQKKIEGGLVTDDSRMQLEVIIDEVHKARLEILYELKKSTKSLSAGFFMKLCCMKVKCSEFKCEGVPSGMVDTYIDIPKLVSSYDKNCIKYLGTSDYEIPFSYSSSRTKKIAPFTPNKKEPYYSLDWNDNKAILFNLPTTNLTYLCGEFLVENPQDALLNSECSDLDEIEYPLPGEFIGRLEDLVFKRLVPKKQVIPDVQNDAQTK